MLDPRTPETVSPWLAEPPAPHPPLEGERETDVAVVGAGMTGLGAALALRSEGLRVIVLEAETAGFGASGRNAGHVTPTIGKDLFTLTRLYGAERVGALVRLMEVAISHVESLIRKHAIDCDYEAVGNVVAAVHPSQHRQLDRAAEAAAKHGVPGEVLEADAMERRRLPRAFTRGYHEPHGGLLHPGRYVRGLREAALRAGAELFERTPALEIEDAEPASVRTALGRVRCRAVMVATNAYTPRLGIERRRGVPLWVQLFRTEPLAPPQREALGWRGREGIYTAHELLENYRWTPDGRILGGTKAVRYGYGSRPLPDVDAGVSRRLEALFRERFPELAGVRIERHWGGPIFATLDLLPVVRRIGRRGNLLLAAGYAGHGIPLASYAGEMLVDRLLDRDGLGAVLADRLALPLPPEPLRWLVFQALNGAFRLADRRPDRLATGRAVRRSG